MFQSVEDLSQKLSETGYFIDPTMTKVVFLADQMKKPLLLEGPAGSGKTRTALEVGVTSSAIRSAEASLLGPSLVALSVLRRFLCAPRYYVEQHMLPRATVGSGSEWCDFIQQNIGVQNRGYVGMYGEQTIWIQSI
jgi:hypothetical protein